MAIDFDKINSIKTDLNDFQKEFNDFLNRKEEDIEYSIQKAMETAAKDGESTITLYVLAKEDTTGVSNRAFCIHIGAGKVDFGTDATIFNNKEREKNFTWYVNRYAEWLEERKLNIQVDSIGIVNVNDLSCRITVKV